MSAFASALPANSTSMALAGAANATFRPRLVTAAADTSDTNTRRRHWKAGEFPFPTTSPSSGTQQRRRPRTTERPPPPPPSKGEDPEGRGRQRHWKAGEDPEGGGRQRHWRAGEFPAAAESQSQSGRRGRARTPIKNVQKRLDARADAKAWACTVTEALADRIAAKNWREALQVFEMLKEQTFYYPKEGTYMKLLLLLGRSGQPSLAQDLFTEMQQQGCQPTPELYTALIGAYCRNGLLDEALKLLEDMKAAPLCQPDVYTYSILIKAFVDASRFDLVDAMYKEMAERSVTPNTVTQNIVLSGYCRAGRLDDMEKLLSAMLESANCKPDVWTMNIILSLFGNSGQVELMEKWYEKFRGYGIEPETRTFNILIGAYGKKRMYDKMSAVMEYMRRLAFPWTTATYNNVIEAFAVAGDAKNMEDTFNQMRSEGMKPDTKTFCCLINGFSNAALFHKVVGMVKLAERLDVPANTSFHNSVLAACAKAEDLMEMERVFRHMKHMQCEADAITYSILLEAYRKEGMTDKMYALQQENPSLVSTELVMV
uniref:Pentacotripeptide-repeat region of PRORP domain-containing protein n=2 Tax=Triticum aestivum TaxID=4565 RepID=A0A3B6HT22_WHEAT